MSSYDKNKAEIQTDEYLVRQAKDGNGTAYDALIEKYRSLAKSVAKKYYIAGADNEDVIQEGTIGIFKAIRDYDQDKSASFKSFVTLCIERQIQTAVSGANREKHRILNESISFSAPASDVDAAETREIEMGEVLTASENENPEKLALLRETFNEFRKLSQEILSELEQNVFQGMVEGKSYKEIAEELNKSPKSIDNAVQRVKRKLGVNN